MEEGHVPLAWLNPSIPNILARPGAANTRRAAYLPLTS
jgi:hypothetical protein